MSIVARAGRVAARGRHLQAGHRIARAARRAGATLDLRVAPSVQIGDVDVRFERGTHNVLSIGANTSLDDGVELRLLGGQVRIGEWVEVRAGVRMMVAGALTITGQNLLSWGVVIHCAEAITLDHQATFGEYVTLVDSVHDRVEGVWHLDRIHTAPVHVGADTWVGAKATITSGVTVGAQCIVAGSAVVTRDVPDGHLAVGIPAVCTPLPRPQPGH